MTPPSRGDVAARLGEPDDQLGSVNDPRTTLEYGEQWNEKWVYHDPEHAGFDRVVLWYRYDFLGVFRVAADGSAEREPGS